MNIFNVSSPQKNGKELFITNSPHMK